MNIQLYFLRVRNAYKQIYGFFERRWKRNLLWTFLLATFFVLGMWVSAAWASEAPSGHVSVREPDRVLTASQRYIRERGDWVSVTTTTTTTTRPPVKAAPVRKSVAAETPSGAQQSLPSGDWVAQCHSWAAEAGIELPPSAITLIGRESSCNPSVMNHGGSGAGGIPQAKPASKMGCSMDAAGAPCQLRWMHGYVMGRYGSWENALAHSNSVGWY